MILFIYVFQKSCYKTGFCTFFCYLVNILHIYIFRKVLQNCFCTLFPNLLTCYYYVFRVYFEFVNNFLKMILKIVLVKTGFRSRKKA